MNDTFLKACRREPVDYTPVWLMRQAGRYMAEYMAIRSKYSFLEMCKIPEIAAEVTLQPVNKLGVDAAILFADILLPLEGMGIQLEFAKNEGPVIHNPVRTRADVDAIRVIEAEEATPYVMEAIRILRRELADKVPLIGFSGAPFTLASYIIEGGGSKNYIECKKMMWQAPEVWHALMDKIAEVILRYLKAQIAAGAQAVQLFDSWVGALSPEDYRQYVLPYSKKVLDGLKDSGVPVIHFANNASSMLELVKEAGGDVIGLDWRINIDDAIRRLGDDVAVQGNLDPMMLFAPPRVIEERVKDILARVGNRPGHIFNLGHGIHKDTPVEHVIALVEAVHKHSRR
ncbi:MULTISPECIES: uroporphyrinogen decarboxylase [Carboxydocella]|uniref:Uroporphyrinogen decarboxylase n=2 Tax=Carboxydocella TaxID=178898 RepID=A0A1T4Q9A6_9FIRM|nr:MULTISPECIES: uroporphyrinogen decarboxylase [Carboxydocella]AVX19347.1 uroporphyrinogen decarboxylase [Carboxydocella thermautotrophica]AVX29761.1 uroporphyrinogen decarboxylase [Carboxydocella thermautotrophica]GAW32772.1 uroporphyrinogen decarboxylase [Carboxydocella sp. JDF658]SKA00319.1 uroporphyrinogen decarboxylase [Carboxydocella sporoproducens DSM 16521]